MFTKKETESDASVTLSYSNLDKSIYVARVPQKAVDLDHIVTNISKSYPSLDPYVIIHSAELIKAEILKCIGEGRAVNVLDLGTLYPTPSGGVSSDNPQADSLPALSLKFKPSKEAKAAISSVKATSFMVKTGEPSIRRVISLKDGSEEGELSRGYPARVEGKNLKIVGEGAGVFFVPEDEDGAPEKDESAWIAADSSYLIRNCPKTLEFYVPEEAMEGTRYFLAVRTRFCSSYKERKEAVTGFSPWTVTVSGA